MGCLLRCLWVWMGRFGDNVETRGVSCLKTYE